MGSEIYIVIKREKLIDFLSTRNPNTQTILKKMAKRANPFSEDFVQQSKVHVGLKQFNHSEERLQKVYEKTLKILFKGAKKVQQNCIKSDVAMNSRKDGLKQLFIGTNGSLLHSGRMMKEIMSQKPCKCGGAKEELCAYCEKTLCVSCEHTCTLCIQNFCAECSLFVSEGSVVCVSCYR